MRDAVQFNRLTDIGFLTNVVSGATREAMRAHNCGDALPKNLLGSVAKRAAGVIRQYILAIPQDHPELHEAIRLEYAKVYADERKDLESRIENLKKQRDGLLAKCREAGIT